MRALRIGGLCCLVAGLALLWAGWSAASVAGSGWSVQRIPSPGRTDSELMAVSCPSPRACVAVGWTGGNQVALVERWSGARWVVQSAFRPRKAFSVLDGVSCTSARMCLAVGYRYTQSSMNALVERWNGRTWRREATPASGAPYGLLDGVSCTSGSSCTAVGAYYDSSSSLATLGERWNGRRWKLERKGRRFSCRFVRLCKSLHRRRCPGRHRPQQRAAG
jgi:hypothetical protein